ncbi:2-hydroxyacid dehydrogenase [Clostridium novyi B str. ATCC 27606]|uniref:2-hydroxyacid dehydrogenase n=2 Tax=Clostridium TaxID=1485 RepID=A0AA40IT26_CLONO|nr:MULTISPECIES: 2-hydroxyacid dehydrogenase [Clostridium]KEI11350.1 2-hydroxyacid dehydrogenase [Clostridium novyi B str. NCTC 9691]KEI13238.1 2-hydroxyacid dehydrogenase [Clostridium novyi B str. ATCC 27606]KEI18161.1 2-hydroxyacid dehydrogenase [Clostridium haemolyticum NCTC 9693]KGN04084.1 2-hydroxyacid dehydrogenase [Clostridium haemolyticum NCTC 8350]OOB75094.1 hydroxyacid dehydrogenase [Clostridium haemolyticum]
MRISILEPLGLSKEEVYSIAKPLIDKGHEIILYEDKIEDTEILKERAKEADVLVLANMPLNGEVIRSDEKLKMVSVAFTGIDHVDTKACIDKNIRICNAAGYSTSSVAELTYGLIFSVFRNIVPLDKATRKGGTRLGFSQSELLGKTIGIVGTGAIGIKVGEIAKAFGCKILAYSRTQKQQAIDLGFEYVSLDELLSNSDIVSLHVPLNNETRGMISREKIKLMKSSSILINTARGPIIDNVALAEALKQGKIAGAGIDVFEVEPPIENSHPLFNISNVVVTPHIAFATKEAMYRRAKITFDNIEKWIEGNPQNIML